jgi:hypothetical protein
VANVSGLRSDLVKEWGKISTTTLPKHIVDLEIVFGIEYGSSFAVYPFVDAEEIRVDRACFGTLTRLRFMSCSSYDNGR